MSELVAKMAVAGLLFGVWPLLMNRSGLQGNTSTAVLVLVVATFVVPTALVSGIRIEGANWWFAIAAAVCSGLGLLAFNSGLAKATPEIVGQLFVTMIVVQTAVPAVYHAVMNGQLTLKTGLGFAAAVIAAILLV